MLHAHSALFFVIMRVAVETMYVGYAETPRSLGQGAKFFNGSEQTQEMHFLLLQLRATDTF